MSRATPIDKEYLKKEYRDATNLNARIRLHQRFSLNPYGWLRWVFDQLDLPPQCRIIELGCGPGSLWLENLDRIPGGWEILLTDFSTGMLEQVKQNLGGKGNFKFQILDAKKIPLPFEDGTFEAVIANHMLYYIPDKPALFSEIRRVLKPGGGFFATTVGERHLSELGDLVAGFDQKLISWSNGTSSFTLENGAQQIARIFPDVSVRCYDDGLAVTELEPLLAYVLSSRLDLKSERLAEFRQYLAGEFESRAGIVRISKYSGIFKAHKIEE